MAKSNSSKGRELKVGKPIQYAPIAIAGMIFGFVPMAMQSSCLSVYFTAVSDGFGVPVSNVTLYLTIGPLLWAIFSPILGQIYAKFNLRVVTSILAVCVAGCFFGMSVAPNVTVFVLCGALLIPCTCGIFNLGMPTLINRWFKDLSGTLIGVCAAFTGIGGVVFIPIGTAVMNAAGDYHTPLMLYAIIVLCLVLPFTIFGIRSYPSERGLLPYVSAKSAKADGGEVEAVKEKNWTVDPNRAMRSGAFWALGIAIGLANMTVLVTRFFATYANELAAAGVAVVVSGAVLATILSGGQAVAKLIIGACSDFLKMKPVLWLATISGIASLALVWLFPTNILMPVGAACFGLFYTAPAVLAPILAGSVFGTGKNYSIVYSRINAVAMVIGMPAGVLWPLIAENFGGYGAAFCVAMVMIACFAALSFLGLRLGKKVEHIPDTTTGSEEAAAEAK